ncbi:MAG: prepilin-type N-terminal cleavage/methylation domain-containing protein [Desulfamplus sp.]|nr:prepilin-type N-terminal cleavage/methylation domain-containing protein [Desulfamplus sp.]
MNRLKIKTKKQQQATESGFTLVEVLISMVIMAVGLLAMASMQITAIQANSYAIHVSEATNLVEDILDEYQKMDYDNLVDEEVSRDIYTAYTSVENNIPAANMKKITVVTKWKSGNRDHEITFGTIVTKKVED